MAKEHQSSKNEFKGGLDYDSDKLTISPDNYTYGLNIRNGVAGKGKFGRITNVKGNAKVNYLLPGGINKCIGSYEYTPTDQVFYFVYNSNANHTILRYDGASIIEVMRFDFGWTEDQKITHIDLVDGKLLYWVDPKPRKINIEKAINVGKKKKWNWYLIGDIVRLQITDEQGTVSDLDFNVPATTLESIVDTLNFIPVFNRGLAATLCSGKVEIEQLTADNGYNIEGQLESIVVAQNFYSEIFEETVYRGKYPFPCFPNVALRRNNDVTYNYIEQRIFQFRTSIVYDDYDYSVMSAISDITVDSCKTGHNYIEVDFTIGKLNDPAQLEIVRAVKLYVREIADMDTTYANAPWKLVKEITQGELWDYSNQLGTNTFDFYNDSTYTVIDEAYSTKQYDALGIEIQCSEFTDNRLVDANFTENYEQPCNNDTIDVEFLPKENPNRFNIEGVIRVASAAQFRGPVISNSGRIGAIYRTGENLFNEVDIPVFGGADSHNILEWTGAGAYQYLPEGGWPIYVAGTDLLTISKQRKITNLSYLPNGVIDATAAGSQDELKGWYSDYEDGIQTGNMLSDFKLEGVPSGRYVIRLGSHNCSFGDKLGFGRLYDLNNNLGYQRTSTHVYGIFDPDNNYNQIGDTEMVIQIADNGDYELSSPGYGAIRTGNIPSGGSVFIGDYIVMDLTEPANYYDSADDDKQNYITGYLYDGGGVGTLQEVAAGTPIERQVIQLDAGTNQASEGVIQPLRRLITDHNGFFFFGTFYGGKKTSDSNLFSYIQLRAYGASQINIKTALDGHIVGNLDQLFNLTAVPDNSGFIEVQDKIHTSSVIYNANQSFYNQQRTVVQGTIIDNTGNGVDGVSVVLTRTSRSQDTDMNGDYSIVAYSQAYSPNAGGYLFGEPQFSPNNTGGNFPGPGIPVPAIDGIFKRTLDYLIFNTGIDCPVVYTNGDNYFVYEVDITYPLYNNTTPYPISDIVFNRPVSYLKKYLKSGGSYSFAELWVDDMNRRCSISTKTDFDKYIPFITEDVNKYYPNIPSQQAEGSFKLTLNLNGSPPDWAVKLYILRTKNANYNAYLQFPVTQIKYAYGYDSDDDSIFETTYQNRDANLIFIDLLGALKNYKEYNAGSNKNWVFEEGDRIRFIRTSDGQLFDRLIDLPIRQQVGDYYVIEAVDDLPELKPGTLIEIFNPKLKTDTDLFFEIPICVDIVNGQYAVNSVELITGDTYRRGRSVTVDGVGGIRSAIEDAALSDFYASTVQDIGRINFEDDSFGRLNRTQALRYSNQYVSDTKINGLSSFEGANVIQLEYQYGAINFLTNTSDNNYREVLLAICSNRVASIYVGEVLYSDVQGDAFIATSDKVLGTNRMMLGEYGTVNPESVVVLDGNVWFWDGIRGRFIKYSVNGLNPISDYFMASYAQEKLRQYTGLNYKVDGVYDRYYRDVIWTFSATEEIPAETLAFNEIKNLWTSFFSFTPEEYSTLNDKVISFLNGELWVHDTNETRDNFYGIQYTSQVKFVHNLNPYQLKLFYSFRENANKKWYLPDITTIPNSSYPVGMKSRVKKNNIGLYEGDFWAEFLRDMNDPAFYNQPQVNALLRGRMLRGGMLEILLENDDTTDADLKYFEVYSYPSDQTNP